MTEKKILLGVGTTVIVALLAVVLLFFSSSLGGNSTKNPSNVLLKLSELSSNFQPTADNKIYVNMTDNVEPQGEAGYSRTFEFHSYFVGTVQLESTAIRYDSAGHAGGAFSSMRSQLSGSGFTIVSGSQIGDESVFGKSNQYGWWVYTFRKQNFIATVSVINLGGTENFTVRTGVVVGVTGNEILQAEIESYAQIMENRI
ncbi:MAG: hypothetical protein AB1305_03935 [Candidatus Hadarchaeota archaeon]